MPIVTSILSKRKLGKKEECEGGQEWEESLLSSYCQSTILKDSKVIKLVMGY